MGLRQTGVQTKKGLYLAAIVIGLIFTVGSFAYQVYGPSIGRFYNDEFFIYELLGPTVDLTNIKFSAVDPSCKKNCYAMLLSGGFPLAFVIDDLSHSSWNQLGPSDIFEFPAFFVDWALYTLTLLTLFKVSHFGFIHTRSRKHDKECLSAET